MPRDFNNNRSASLDVNPKVSTRSSGNAVGLLFFCVLCAVGCFAFADEPASVSAKSAADLTARIDFFIRQGWNQQSIQPAERCSDETFVRRLYLDCVGRIPTVEEATNFINDQRDNKRDVLIDRLLDSEDHVQHFADLFDALLMGRTGEGKYNQRRQHGWRSYLEDVFRSNRPWNDVAGEILLARPDNEQHRGAVWFLYERNNEHQKIAEAIAPAFFGIRIECAQCHDHMSADEIKQAHYWGLVAFFNRGTNVQTKVGPQVAESAIGGFSEFANLSGQSSPNVLTFLGATPVSETRPEKDQKQEESEDLYRSSDADADLPKVPNFSRREAFVRHVLQDNPLVARAMVNRVWAIMLGRGIVHPFDAMDSVHAASHPELLGWLAADFAASGYDIGRLVEAIARSQAYQLSSIQPDDVDDPATFAWYLERPLTAEQLARSIQLVARGGFQNDAGLVKQLRQQIKPVLPDQTVVTVDDALFYSNGTALNDFLNADSNQNTLLAGLSELSSDDERIERLFRTCFCRSPSSQEREAVITYVAKRSRSLDDALRQVLWSMVKSAEFQFNH
ncbi:MAG: DUF1549 domain-containing protein [Pirellulaceae bacterium]